MTGKPFYFVMLTPNIETIIEHEQSRGTALYRDWAWLDEEMRHRTRRIGLWIDTSSQTAEETVAEVLARVWDEGRVDA